MFSFSSTSFARPSSSPPSYSYAYKCLVIVHVLGHDHGTIAAEDGTRTRACTCSVTILSQLIMHMHMKTGRTDGQEEGAHLQRHLRIWATIVLDVVVCGRLEERRVAVHMHVHVHTHAQLQVNSILYMCGHAHAMIIYNAKLHDRRCHKSNQCVAAVRVNVVVHAVLTS